MQDIDGCVCQFNKHLERSKVVEFGLPDICRFFGLRVGFIEEID